jgi:CheY-like chemotaxis protein
MRLPLRLLVADDDATLREILCEGLSDEGFDVDSAEDGQRALELFRSHGPYDALLLDEEMPRLTGRQTIALIRAGQDDVPALLVSGNLVMDETERAALGVGPVLLKPVTIRELAKAVRDAVASRPARAVAP